MSVDLAHFLTAQDFVYEQVLAELRAGRKRSHWIWFIFPQFAALGRSYRAQRFGLRSRAEAESYLAHPVLGARLRTCTELLLTLPTTPLTEILGAPDDTKFHASMTLFAAVAGPASPYQQALDRWFGGAAHEATATLLTG